MGSRTATVCPWCTGSQLYRTYHDTEWGVPCRDPEKLFEMICLEGAQAGLSWITILKKRDAYRKLFRGFKPDKIARLTDSDLNEIAANPAIVRHKGKVLSVRSNAQAWLDMEKHSDGFADFVWSFVDGQVRQNRFEQMGDVPAKTPESTAMSKAMQAAGFKFAGPTICYAFMQSAGLVNDHLTNCPRHKALSPVTPH